MADTYWIRNRGRTNGPYSIESLQQMAARGQFSTVFQVSKDEVTWKRASAYPELFPAEAKEKQSNNDSEPISKAESECQLAETIEVPNNNAQTDSMWRYVKHGNPSEPINFKQLQHLASEGIIPPDGLVWNESLPNWVKAKDVSGLMSTFQREWPGGGLHGKPVDLDEKRPLSQLAVASFVCGVVGASSGLFILLGLLAVILGHVSLYTKQIRDGELRGRGWPSLDFRSAGAAS